MGANVAEYYPNSLCFEDPGKVRFLSNFMDSKYNNIIISIDACKNTLEHPNKCASKAEIKKFISENIIYSNV